MTTKCVGNCTMCGAENVKLTIIDDEDRVCDECLEDWFCYCDECHEYWRSDVIDFFALDDDRLVCEHCMENLEEE